MTLGIYLDQDKSKNKEKWDKAKQIKAAMDLDMISEEHGLASNVKSKANFIDYFQAQTDKVNHPGTRSTWQTALDYLKAYAGDNVEFRTIDEAFIEGYISFLSKKKQEIRLLAITKNSRPLLTRLLWRNFRSPIHARTSRHHRRRTRRRYFL